MAKSFPKKIKKIPAETKGQLSSLYAQRLREVILFGSYARGDYTRGSDIELTDDQKIFLDEVNDFNLEIRYPDYKKAFYLDCSREYTTENFNKIKEIYQWLKSRITSEA